MVFLIWMAVLWLVARPDSAGTHRSNWQQRLLGKSAVVKAFRPDASQPPVDTGCVLAVLRVDRSIDTVDALCILSDAEKLAMRLLQYPDDCFVLSVSDLAVFHQHMPAVRSADARFRVVASENAWVLRLQTHVLDEAIVRDCLTLQCQLGSCLGCVAALGRRCCRANPFNCFNSTCKHRRGIDEAGDQICSYAAVLAYYCHRVASRLAVQ